VKFDEQVFDYAAYAVKKLIVIRNISAGDDIISNDMRLVANDDENEDEYAKGSKAATPVDAQNSGNHVGDVKCQEVEEVEEIRRYPLRNRAQTPAWNLAAHATQTPDSPTVSSALASNDKDNGSRLLTTMLAALEDAGTWTMVQHQLGPESKTRHCWCDHQGQRPPCFLR
jgi:hypothetical protein